MLGSLLLLCIGAFAYAGEGSAHDEASESSTTTSKNSDNFEIYDNNIIAALYAASATAELDFGISDNELSYTSDEITADGISIAHKSYSISISYALIRDPLSMLRSAQQDSFSLDKFGREYAAGISVNRFNKFVLTDAKPEAVEEELKDSRRGDMRYASYNAYGFYAFSPENFSLNSALSFSERQKTSGGSFLAGTNADYSRLRSSLLFAATEDSDDPPLTTLSEVTTVNVGVLGGYAHTFVFWKRAYFSLGALLGAGLQRVTYVRDDETHRRTIGGRISRSFSALGYAGETYFVAFTSQTSSLATRATNEKFTFDSRQGYFYLGRRF
ncbi:MAG: DUF4421 family protein [Oligoflexales bacterium]